VIPWNVLIGVGGAPIFTCNDERKHWTALTFELCPLCGEANGREMWFVGGPRSAFDPDGWYIDLPSHQECAEFALQTCPYLAAPRYEGRIDLPDPSKVAGHAVFIDETLIPERPSLFVAVACTRIEFTRAGPRLPYVRPVKPWLGIQYWRQGERLSDAEGERLVQSILHPEVTK